MARAVFLLLLAVAIVSISAYPDGQKCDGENEEYNACGSTCPSTCKNPVPPVCTLACIPGCDCAEGYVRNAENKCVLVQNC